MKRFTFKLQKLLDHRMRIEDEKKRSFVKTRVIYLKEKQRLDDMKEKLDVCNSRNIKKKADIFQYIVMSNYTAFLQESIEDQTKLVDIREEEMNTKKHDFEESRKDRKVIDKLRENAQFQYNVFIDKLDQKQNDEFALHGYTRR